MPANTLIEPQTRTRNVNTQDAAHLRFPGSVLARFLEYRGRKIVRACGAVWYAAPGRFLMSLPYQRMHDCLELPQCRWVAENAVGELSTIDTAADTCAWERLIDRCDGVSLIQRVYNGIGIEHRYSHLRKEAGSSTFAHSDRAREPQHNHAVTPRGARFGARRREAAGAGAREW